MSDLLEAVLNCDLRKLKYFLDGSKNANFVIPGTEGCTILHIIAGTKTRIYKEETIAYLIDMGASPNARSDEDLTPVHIASMWNNSFELEILLQRGGNPWLLDNEGKNSFDLAADNYAYDTYRLLNQYHAEDKLNFRIMDLSFEIKSTSLTDDEPADNTKRASDIFFRTANEYFPLEFSSSDDESFLVGVSKIIKKQNVKNQLVEDDIQKWNDFANDLKSNSWTYKNAAALDIYAEVLPLHKRLNKNNEVSSDDSSETIVASDDVSGVVLVEENSPSNPFTLYEEENCHNYNSLTVNDWKSYSTIVLSSSSDCSSFSSNCEITVPEKYSKLSNSNIYRELVDLGDKPGPVNDFTREVYLKRLTRLESGCKLSCSLPEPKFHPEIYLFLNNKLKMSEIEEYVNLMTEEFNNSKLKSKWRGGGKKCCFNYFLLDPRVTQNLPARQASLKFEQKFQIFIDAIFYVGKGTKGRPYNHLIDAAKATVGLSSKSDKIAHILDIWDSGLGVISLHCFHNCIPAEAYTEEACIIEALGLKNLTNVRLGDYYGQAVKWTKSQKRKVGISLLHRAMQIFLHEGEKQIKPRDLKDK